jgi:hypothetical protein
MSSLRIDVNKDGIFCGWECPYHRNFLVMSYCKLFSKFLKKVKIHWIGHNESKIILCCEKCNMALIDDNYENANTNQFTIIKPNFWVEKHREFK